MQGIKHKFPLQDWKTTVRSFQNKTHFSAENNFNNCPPLANSGQSIGPSVAGGSLLIGLFCFICLTLCSSLFLGYFLREIFPLLDEEMRTHFYNGINISKLQGKVASENVCYLIRQRRGIYGMTFMDLKWSLCFIMVTKDLYSLGENITITH